MPEENNQERPETPSDRIRKAFELESDRLSDSPGSLDDAEQQLRHLQDLRTKFLGKKSELATQKKMIGSIDPKLRRDFAVIFQKLEQDITQSIDDKELRLRTFVLRARTERESIDVTMPGRRPRRGHLHPITLMRERIEDIFVALGYAVEDDREIETDFYNFDALNIPEGHPARDPQDTFYTTDGFALRSQTSTVQIHSMQKRGAPVRMSAPGRVFRRDTPDPTHNPMFFQVEGLCVDRGITMAHLKGTLAEFVHRLFGPETRTRFRPVSMEQALDARAAAAARVRQLRPALSQPS